MRSERERSGIMSTLIDLVGGVIKAVGAARATSHAAGLDTPVLDDLHDGLSPVRTAYNHARMHHRLANAGAGQAAQPTDPSDTGTGDPVAADDGFFSDVTQWIADRIDDLF
jgi:hypothetical protein